MAHCFLLLDLLYGHRLLDQGALLGVILIGISLLRGVLVVQLKQEWIIVFILDHVGITKIFLTLIVLRQGLVKMLLGFVSREFLLLSFGRSILRGFLLEVCNRFNQQLFNF